MAKRSSKRTGEPPILRRLRKATQTTGLISDLFTERPITESVLVTSRLAQAIINHLTDQYPEAGEALLDSLRDVASQDELDLLTRGRGFTFFHVIQYLYEWARCFGAESGASPLPETVGLSGGGLHIDPEQDIISLVRLLVTALPEDQDRRNIGLLIRTLSPMFLEKIFVTGDFKIDVRQHRDDRVNLTLQFTDPSSILAYTKALGIEKDLGAFFWNAALQIQGTVQLGLHTFARSARRLVRVRDPIQGRSPEEQEEIVRSYSCSWEIAWSPKVRLNRTGEPKALLELVRTVYESLHRRDLEYYQERVKVLETRIKYLEEDGFEDFIGRSDVMQRVYKDIEQVAATDFTVLIRGETGTGKELVAKAIHNRSSRHSGPFVTLNCAAFPDSLLESELFGHEKGAFTDAHGERAGRFEMADGGTLFLDEVGDVPLRTQIKLLRVLETREFERLGGTKTLQTDVRILAATNRNLEQMIAAGEIREDFFYRLNVLPLQIPTLREHLEDIPLLAQHFLKRSQMHSDRHVNGLSRSAVRQLLTHSWPGNVRELRSVIERAVVYGSETTITEFDIKRGLGVVASPHPMAGDLSERQQSVLGAIEERDGSTIDEILPDVAGKGGSKRTVQNDLKKLSALGYIRWRKRGPARLYICTSEGKEILG